MIILGSGPNRIGQGIEFDYSCVHASLRAARRRLRDRDGQLQPRDGVDRLRHLRPALLRAAHARGRARGRRTPSSAAGPVAGVIVAARRPDAARPGAGGSRTPACRSSARSPEAIHLAEDRGAFGRVLADAGLPAPRARHGHVATTRPRQIADEIGYPVLVRPSYVLGGRGMEIVYDDEHAARPTSSGRPRSRPDHPVLVDRFLDDAIEIDVDALYDGDELYLGGVMEHIEEAGIHSGDSACALPPDHARATRTSSGSARRTEAIAAGVGVRGLLNVQFALAARRALRARGQPARVAAPCRSSPRRPAMPLAKAAARVMLGATIAELRAEGLLPAERRRRRPCRRDAPIAVKEAVMPFNRFRTATGATSTRVLGPEMRSTGEVMGIDADFGTAFAKSQAGGVRRAADQGRVFVSVANRDKRHMIFPVKRLADLGFEILATAGHRRGAAPQRRRRAPSCASTATGRGPDGEPTIVEPILDGEVDLVVNTPYGTTSGGRRGSTATRSARPRSSRTSRASRRSRGWPRRSRASRRCAPGDDRRAVAAGLGRRSLSRRPDGETAREGRPLQVRRRGALDQAGRRLPPPHLGRPPGSPSGPDPGTSSRSPSGADSSAMLLRRAFSIYRVRSARRLRRHRRDRLRRARQGNRVAGPASAR